MHASESSELAARLLVSGCLREGLAGRPLVLHSDIGAAMKGVMMLATMQNLGVIPSFSRPRVSNDNAHAETVYLKAYVGVSAACAGLAAYLTFYNTRRPHQAHRGATPDQVYFGALGEERIAA